MSNADSLVVAPLSGPEELDAFIRLAWDFNQDDPLWVPPLVSMQRDILDRKTGPFFEFGDACYFLARRGDKLVGRISAHVNGLYEQYHDSETGFFGFFECENNRETAHALFDAAADWVRQKGKVKLHGPLSFSIYDEVGLLVEGFDSPPCMMHTHNPPYYEDLVTSYGFAKTFDWYAYRISHMPYMDVAKLRKLRDTILSRANARILPIERKDFAKRAPRSRNSSTTSGARTGGIFP